MVEVFHPFEQGLLGWSTIINPNGSVYGQINNFLIEFGFCVPDDDALIIID